MIETIALGFMSALLSALLVVFLLGGLIGVLFVLAALAGGLAMLLEFVVCPWVCRMCCTHAAPGKVEVLR